MRPDGWRDLCLSFWGARLNTTRVRERLGRADGPNFAKGKKNVQDKMFGDKGRPLVALLDMRAVDGRTKSRNDQEGPHSKNVRNFRERDVQRLLRRLPWNGREGQRAGRC